MDWMWIGNILVNIISIPVKYSTRIFTKLITYLHDLLQWLFLICIVGGRHDSPGKPSDKANFALLLHELRDAFGRVNRETPYLLTAAVSAEKVTIDQAYDVTALAETLDIISVMTYGYHGW